MAEALTTERLIAQAKEKYKNQFGSISDFCASAPGRVNLIGEHIDYNDGFVLPLAIKQRTVFVAGRRDDGLIKIYSASGAVTTEIDLAQTITPLKPNDWSNYLRGVLYGFQEAFGEVSAMNVLIDSNVPEGAGLSSSAAVEVGFANLLEAVTGNSMDPMKKALLCQKAEHDFADVPCGIMDQVASIFGERDHLVLLDCRSNTVEKVPFGDPNLIVIVSNSNVKHQLGDGEYAKRRAECASALAMIGKGSWRDVTACDLARIKDSEHPVLLKRARHVVSEMQRTLDAVAAIRRGDWTGLGSLMAASHRSLRDDYEVSCLELDLLVEIAESIGQCGGVFGARMTGGGFGGSTVTLAKRESVNAIMEEIQKRYFDKTGIHASIFATRPE